MEDKPLVTAIITSHDRRELVEKAINSVLCQTYDNIELIVVDDKSNQENSDYVRKLAEKKGFRYIYIPAEESKGGNHARNVGVKNSKGQYIAFLDDDDEWMPEKTAAQVDFLKNHPEYGVVSCLRVKEIDYKKRVLENKEKIEGDIGTKIFTCIPFLTSTIMMRKTIIEQINGFDEDLRYWQEYDLSIRYSQCTKVGYLKQHLCLYRIIHSDKNRLTNKINGWEEAVERIEAKYKNMIDNIPPEFYKKHQMLIARDGRTRAKNAGDRKKAIYYSKKMVEIEPSIKNKIKMIFTFLNI